MGSKAPSSNTTFEHYEETYRHHSISATFSSASATNAAAVTLTLAADSYNEKILEGGDDYSGSKTR